MQDTINEQPHFLSSDKGYAEQASAIYPTKPENSNVLQSVKPFWRALPKGHTAEQAVIIGYETVKVWQWKWVLLNR